MSEQHKLLVFELDNHRYALCLSTVERTARIVEITPLPQGPDILSGVINVQGRVVPVIDIRKLFHLPSKEAALSDQLIIVTSSVLKAAIPADNVVGVFEYQEQDVTASEKIFPGIEHVDGVARLADGLVFIYNLDRLLTLKEKVITEYLSRTDERGFTHEMANRNA